MKLRRHRLDSEPRLY